MAAAASGRRGAWWACLFLLLASTLPYISLLDAGFVHWDDDTYVTENERVQRGITPKNVGWAFSTTYFGFYYPLTWLSHMLDCSLFGLRGGGHHATSILIHCLTVLLLFWFFREATGDLPRSLMLAALFAVHPLNVESVAWISERKNVLSGLFFVLCMCVYLRYSRKPSAASYLLLFACMLLGLMSKPVLVTLPAALYILDFWPLRRLEPTVSSILANRRLLIEKLPLLLPVPVFTALTIAAQKQAGALATAQEIPLDQRAAQAVLGYVNYLFKFFFPLHLTAFYRHVRDKYTAAGVISAVLLLAALTVLLLRFRVSGTSIAAGWAWFGVNLLPVIGLIQVGEQGSADRYMYLPMIGLLWALLFGLPGEKKRFPAWAAALVAAAFLLMAAKTAVQATTWKDTEALFSHMTKVSPEATQGFYNMAKIFKERGEYARAVEYNKKVLELNPKHASAYNNLGGCYAATGDYTSARECYAKACELAPERAHMLFNLALSTELLGNKGEAGEMYRKVLEKEKGHASARKRLINILVSEGNTEEARELAIEGTRLFPSDPEFRLMAGPTRGPGEARSE